VKELSRYKGELFNPGKRYIVAEKSYIIHTLLFAKFIRETQISKTKCIEICKSNNPDEVGGYNTPLLCRGIWVQGLP